MSGVDQSPRGRYPIAAAEIEYPAGWSQPLQEFVDPTAILLGIAIVGAVSLRKLVIAATYDVDGVELLIGHDPECLKSIHTGGTPPRTCRLQGVEVDLLLETFGSTWQDIREGALAAEEAGFAAVWVNDHLAGSVGTRHTCLSVGRCCRPWRRRFPGSDSGPLVLNVANRDPGTLAVMAATLQHVSGGRLLLGIGAGAQWGTPGRDRAGSIATGS